MRILLALLFIFVGLQLEAKAAAPVISCTPSRTTGTAPLFVHLDCTGTTDADTSKPFHDLFYVHTFGDPSAGLWANGSNTALSKNFATGAVAGHIYETAGTYTITSTVSDGTNIARTTNTITVSDPDTTFSGTNTICFYNTTLGTGCPAGADSHASSDWDNAIHTYEANGKRLLFKKGDTFTGSIDTQFNKSGATIGAYGSGALPIINMDSGVGLSLETGASDVRVMDLDIRNTGSTFNAIYAGNGAYLDNITILRVTSTTMTGGAIISYANSGFVLQDSTLGNNGNAEVLFMECKTRCAILGNTMGPATLSYQTFRHATFQRSVIAHNTITGGTTQPSSVETVALRANDHVTAAEDSFYNIFSDNKVTIGAVNCCVLKLAQPASDARVYDYVLERNWFLASARADFNNIFVGVRITVRNNLVDVSALTGSGGTIYALEAKDRLSVAPHTDDMNIYNNTIYSGSYSSADLHGITINANVTNTIIKNNLCWLDLGATTQGCVFDFGTSTVASNNSSDGQTTGTDPQFDTPLSSPIGFRIGTSSYAATGGTPIWPASNDDFFHCDDTTANEHMGAFISRTRATCRGAAGP